MKFEEQESIDDSLEEVGAETENSSNEETKPMLDYCFRRFHYYMNQMEQYQYKLICL